MKNKTTFSPVIVNYLLFLLITFNLGVVSAQTSQQLLRWNANNTSDFGPSPWAPTSAASEITTNGLNRGSAIGTTSSAAQDCWGGSSGWTVTNGATTTDSNSFYFDIKPNMGYTIHLSTIETRTKRSPTGPTKYKLEYSIDGITYTSLGEKNTTTNGSNGSHSLTAINNLQNITFDQTVKFRITPQGTTGNYYLDGSNALIVKGIVEPAIPCETPQPTATTQTFCSSALVGDLQATGTEIKWYATATSTTPLSTDATIVTGTYYVSQTINSCESTRKSVVVTVNQTAMPTTNDQTFCTEATVNDLTATGTDIKWYATTTAGEALSETTALTTGTTYYATQTTNNCESARKPIIVTILQTAIPTTTDQAFCNLATIESLTATGTDLKWYATASSTEVLPSTTLLTNGTSYYVSQTVNNCESARKEVEVTINSTSMPVVENQIFCLQATVADLVANGSSIKWYATVDSSNILAENTALATGTYYVTQTINSCESERKAVNLTINETALPTAASQIFCNGAMIQDLVATGTDIKWYASPTSTEVLSNNTNLTSGTYYVTQTINSCESLRKAVAVTVHFTTTPLGDTQTFCAHTTVSNLVASGQNLKWYATSNSTEVLSADTILATGTYYVTQTINNCESVRKAVSVIIKDIVSPLTAQNFSLCYGASLHQVNGLINTSGVIKWYASATSNTALANNTLINSDTYYATRTVDNCESAKTAFQLTILPSLNKPTAGIQTFCGSATVGDLIAQGINGATLLWYSNATTQNPLANETILSSGIYYVAQNLNSCFSERRAVTVKIINMAAPQITAFQFCEGATVANLQLPTPTGITYRWYASASETTALTQNTALISGTYYVSKVEAGCESTRKAVTVTINSIPNSPTGSIVQSFEEGAVIGDIVMDQTNIVWYITFNDALNGSNPISNIMPLENGKTYYSVLIGTNGCPSLPTAVTINVRLDLNDFDKNALKYYPNPVDGLLTIHYSEAISGIEVYDLLGRKISEQKTSSKEVQIDCSSLAKGTYMIKLSTDSKNQLIKVMKK